MIIDNQVRDIAHLLLDGSDLEMPWRRFLDRESLDFSVTSVSHLDDYLSDIQNLPGLEKVWNLVVLRCGAYLGEVIRTQSTSRDWHWLDFNEASQIGIFEAQHYDRSIDVEFVLFDGDRSFLFPLAKVQKRLSGAKEHNLQYFANKIVMEPGLAPF